MTTPAPMTPEQAEEAARRLYRGLEMHCEIMLDRRRTGGWAGAQRVADAFRRQSEVAKTLQEHLSAARRQVEHKLLDRDQGGRSVREAWVRWACQQPEPKPSWLLPYDDLNEADKEADRQIYESIAVRKPVTWDQLVNAIASNVTSEAGDILGIGYAADAIMALINGPSS